MDRTISDLSAVDRRIGAELRRATTGRPGGAETAHLAAESMAPFFVLLVGAMIAVPATRRTGGLMLVAGGGASLLARSLRDRLARPRPGPRAEGGMPSRHAAAATAISAVLGAAGSALAPIAWIATALGGGARIASGHHEPADILAGAGLGATVGAAVSLLAGVLVGWRR